MGDEDLLEPSIDIIAWFRLKKNCFLGFFYYKFSLSIADRRRKSAVELLEASKGEYVKSVSVLKQKQELKHPENLQISTR